MIDCQSAEPRAEKSGAAKPSVLIVEDEASLRQVLKISLESHGYNVIEADNGMLGLRQVAERNPAVVILDLSLPGMDGLEVLFRLREWSNVPVIVLSVRSSEADKIQALRIGADDYMTKPFGVGELLARLEVARRHSQGGEEASVFQSGPLEVDFAARQVTVQGRRIKLSETEYALLRLFVKHCGKVLTHRQILESVWGPSCVEKTHYLHVYVTHLRHKIELDSQRPSMLITEPRVGYRLQVESPV